MQVQIKGGGEKNVPSKMIKRSSSFALAVVVVVHNKIYVLNKFTIEREKKKEEVWIVIKCKVDDHSLCSIPRAIQTWTRLLGWLVGWLDVWFTFCVHWNLCARSSRYIYHKTSVIDCVSTGENQFGVALN